MPSKLLSPDITARDNTAVAPRRVLSRESALALARRILDADASLSSVRVDHIARSATKVSNGNVTAMNDGDFVRVSFPTQFDAGFSVMVWTNQFDDAFINKVLAETIGKVRKPNTPPIPPDVEGDNMGPEGPRPLMKVDLYHDATVAAMETARGTAIPAILSQLRSAQMNGAATVRLLNRSALYCYRQGLVSFVEETDCDVSVTARSLDNKAPGWAGQAHRDWTKVSPAAVTAKAIEIAKLARNPVAVEPGRRLVILPPAAVAQLLWPIAPFFGGAGPLSNTDQSLKGKRTKMGMRVMDPRLMMTSDPADPEGGYPPVMEGDNAEFWPGFPAVKKTWIDHGVLSALAYWIRRAAKFGVTPADFPYAVRLEAAPGTSTLTIEEMIANCKEGIYVNRFTEPRIVDYESAVCTGATRDGCFLIKDGKISKPVVNLRFLESPFFAFNRVEAIGKPERVALGEGARNDSNFRMPADGIPRLPVVAPPLMIRDFNFSALASAV